MYVRPSSLCPAAVPLGELCAASRALARPEAAACLPYALARALVPLLAEAAAVDAWIGGRWRRAVAHAGPAGGAEPAASHPSPLATHPLGCAALLAHGGPRDGSEFVGAAAASRASSDGTCWAALLARLAAPLLEADARADAPALLVVPLHHGGRPLGLVTLWRRGVGAHWPAACRHAAELLATQGAAVLEAASLAERAGRGVQQATAEAAALAFLQHAADALAEAACLDDVLDVLTRLGVAQLAHGCAVELCGDPDARRTVVSHVDPARRLQLASFLRALEGRRRRGPGRRRAVPPAPPADALRLPMAVRGAVRGYVTFLREAPRGPFDAADEAMARALVARAGEAVDRVWRTAELEQVSRVRDEFLRVASHELRTPLAALQLQLAGLRRLCLRDDADAPTRQALQERAERALQQIGRLAHLTDSLLDAARTFGGPDRLALRRRRVALSRMCRRVLDRVGPEAARRGCPLALHVHAEVEGHYDAAQLARALRHLLANAVKYGAQAPVELHLGRRGRWAVLQVRDHGIGVASHARPRIFGRFERAVSGRTFGGLGLGLYLARRVVAAHGGTIRVRNNAGGGAAFVVLLPLLAATDPRDTGVTGDEAGAAGAA